MLQLVDAILKRVLLLCFGLILDQKHHRCLNLEVFCLHSYAHLYPVFEVSGTGEVLFRRPVNELIAQNR